MIKTVLTIACTIVAALSSPSAWSQSIATPNADTMALGKCLVGKSNGEDRILIAQWVGASIAMSPEMQDIVTVDAQAKDRLDRRIAETFTRLMSEDCRSEMTVMVRKNDAMGIQAASGMLGQMAMQELLRDPATMQALIAYGRYMDPALMQKLAE